MSRLRVQEALAGRLEEVRERFRTACDQFRESRLYVQTICALVLVAVSWLVHLLPYGPLERVDAALSWSVTADYDFAGKARQAGDWARARGGWRPAIAGLWEQGVGQVREWVGPVGPFAQPQTAVTGPVDLAGGASPGGAAPVEPGPLTPVPQTPLQPVEGSVLAEYGWLPQSISEEFHEGIDFYTEVGAPVLAVMDGTVQAVRPDQRLGTVVEIRHDEVVGVYAQVEAVSVSAGDRVTRGQKIAAVARSRGLEQNMPPHLHFEIRPVSTGEPVNPASYLGLGGKKL